MYMYIVVHSGLKYCRNLYTIWVFSTKDLFIPQHTTLKVKGYFILIITRILKKTKDIPYKTLCITTKYRLIE